MNMVWLGVTVVAAVSGTLLGAGLSWSAIHRRARLRERRLMAAAQEREQQVTRNLRATTTRLQMELETERASVQRRIQAGLAEHRAATTRLEEQLRFAYMEIDRLKARLAPAPAASNKTAATEDGFALTQPFTP